MDRFIETNGICLHVVDFGGEGESLILMHGLTANAHNFDGLIAGGLTRHAQVLAVDLRGRGQSDKPGSGYAMADHARDIVGLLDALGLEQVILGGHSFGGLLAIYIAAHYPERVKKLVIIDAGILHPSTRQLIQPSIDRLGKTVPSWETFLEGVKKTPYYHDGFWDAALETYYRADVEELPDGSVKPRSSPAAITEAADKVLDEDWLTLMERAPHPAIMLHATEGLGPAGTPPVITKDGAQLTVEALPHCRYVPLGGNHITMLFGKNAPAAVRAIADFLGE